MSIDENTAADEKKRASSGGLPPLMTVGEVADYLRVTENTVYNLISKRGLPAVRLGRGLRVREDQLQDWLARRTENGTGGD